MKKKLKKTKLTLGVQPSSVYGDRPDLRLACWSTNRVSDRSLISDKDYLSYQRGWDKATELADIEG